MVKTETAAKKKNSVYAQFKKVIGVIIMVFYHLRKAVMAIPVVYAALLIAQHNSTELMDQVGLFLQSNGDFLIWISRDAAVMWPLVITAGCLVLMCFSRKAMYAWAISIFSLALPILIWFSNTYPKVY